nr:MFS transporter [Lactobacillus helveticus]
MLLSNSLFGMIIIWWLQTQTRKSSLVGLTNAIFSITVALSIFYGPIIDKHSFKRTSQTSLLVQTILLFLLTAVMFWLSHDIVLTILISTILSMCDEFFSPADRALLKESVPSKKDLNSLISKLSMIDQVVNIAGIALSGVLLSLLIAGQSMLVCSCLSLISIFFLYIALRKIPSTKPQANDTDDKTNNYRAKVFSGLKYIRQNRFLKYYFWSSICYSFVSPALIILLPKLADKLGSAGLYSTFYLCFVGGFLLGALISGKLTPTVKTISYTWMLSTIPLLMIIFFLSNWFALSVLIALFGFLTSFQNILSESMIQITTEDAYLGRVLTTIRTSTSIGGPISSVVAGIMLDHSGDQILIILCAVFVLIGESTCYLQKKRQTKPLFILFKDIL